MKAIYNNGRAEETLEVQNFYKEIAEKMSKEDMNFAPFFVNVTVPDHGNVRYKVQRRSDTQFIAEENNTLSDDLIDRQNITDKFLTCVDPAKNSYKFYKLSIMGDTVRASYGRMGTNKGDLFGERSFDYPIQMFWVKYYEKIGKGYLDRTDIYLPSSTDVPESKKSVSTTQRKNMVSAQLFNELRSFAKKHVERAKVQVPITPVIIQESKKLLDNMRAAETVEEFNKHLLDLISILQRPVRTGDGSGVRKLMAGEKSSFARIINREKDLIQAMEGTISGQSIDSGDFSDYDIEVHLATDRQKEDVLRHLSDSLKPKVKAVYRVIPHEQKKIFNDYLKKNGIKKVKQFWHGSRNCNWMSIVQNSLLLNPDAIITGKMFGNGIYFAPSSLKSWNYTSYRGTSWAHGHDDKAFMGLYAVAYGKPCDVDTWSSSADYKKMTLSGGYNCLHAHAGASLKNDEIIFYDEAAVLLNYIVEFE